MKQRVVLGLFLLLAAGILSCSSPDSAKFSSAAAQAGLAEVELGRLAANGDQIRPSRVSDNE